MSDQPATGRVSPSLLVVLLAALTMIGPFTIDTIFPGFAAVERDFAVDAVVVQQTISIYLVVFAVMSLVHGPVSDALGRRPVIVWGLLAYAATSALCAAAPSMGWLLAGRALQGVVAGAGLIVGRTVVRDVFDGERAQRAMSRMSMIFGVAPALAPIVGGWLLGWSSWRAIFWFLAALGLALAAASWGLLPETHPTDRRTPLRLGALTRAVLDAGGDAGVRRLLAVSSFNFAALFTYIAAAPAIIVDHLGLGPSDFGWLFVPIVSAMITGSWLTGRLAGRLRAGHFITGGFALATIGAVIQLGLDAAGWTRLPWVLVSPTLTGLGIALVFPIVTLALLELRPRHRGTLSSLQSFTNTMLNAVVSGVVVPLVSGHLLWLTAASLTWSVLGWSAWARHRRLAAATASRP